MSGAKRFNKLPVNISNAKDITNVLSPGKEFLFYFLGLLPFLEKLMNFKEDCDVEEVALVVYEMGSSTRLLHSQWLHWLNRKLTA